MGSTITTQKSRGKYKQVHPTQEQILRALPEAESRVIARLQMTGITLEPLLMLNELAASTYVILAERIPHLSPPTLECWHEIARVAMQHHAFSKLWCSFCSKEEIRAEAVRILAEKKEQS